MSFDISDAGHVLKKTYAGAGPENLASRGRVLLSQTRKVGGFSGESDHRVPIIYGNNAAISASFSKAQANAGSSQGLQWNLTRTTKYGLFTISGEWLAAADNTGSFVRGMKHAVDNTLDEFGHQLSIDLYGAGTGVIGKVATGGVTGEVITLDEADDVKNFQVGMKLQVFDAATGGTAQGTSATVPATVASVDEDGGTITLTSGNAAATAIAAADFLCMDGNYDATAKGLKAWLPDAAPSAGESFFGNDRSVDVARLSGSRVIDTGLSLQEAAMDLATSLNRRGSRAKDGYLNPVNWNKLAKELDAKVEREAGEGGVFGFPFISMATPVGMIKFWPDQDCPIDAGYIIDHRGFYIKHLMGLPHLVEDDNNKVLRQASADGVEGRFRCFWQPVFSAPAWSGVFLIA